MVKEQEILKSNSITFETCRHVVVTNWNNGGREEEARDCFRLFDWKGKNFINAGDLKQTWSKYIDFPVSENDIQDFISIISECGGNVDGSGNVPFKSFAKFYMK